MVGLTGAASTRTRCLLALMLAPACWRTRCPKNSSRTPRTLSLCVANLARFRRRLFKPPERSESEAGTWDGGSAKERRRAPSLCDGTRRAPRSVSSARLGSPARPLSFVVLTTNPRVPPTAPQRRRRAAALPPGGVVVLVRVLVLLRDVCWMRTSRRRSRPSSRATRPRSPFRLPPPSPFRPHLLPVPAPTSPPAARATSLPVPAPTSLRCSRPTPLPLPARRQAARACATPATGCPTTPVPTATRGARADAEADACADAHADDGRVQERVHDTDDAIGETDVDCGGDFCPLRPQRGLRRGQRLLQWRQLHQLGLLVHADGRADPRADGGPAPAPDARAIVAVAVGMSGVTCAESTPDSGDDVIVHRARRHHQRLGLQRSRVLGWHGRRLDLGRSRGFRDDSDLHERGP